MTNHADFLAPYKRMREARLHLGRTLVKTLSKEVLDEAGLIVRTKKGRTVMVNLSPGPMREAMDWLSRYERFWSKSLDRLATYAESTEAETRRKKG